MKEQLMRELTQYLHAMVPDGIDTDGGPMHTWGTITAGVRAWTISHGLHPDAVEVAADCIKHLDKHFKQQ
tara:strand:+ start:157 stop:366 length:210 start_codon:yes stop_codon:yes gene_type:complete